MILTEEHSARTFTWQLVSEDEDAAAQAGLNVEFARSSISFTLPSGWSADSLHPDLHALAALLALRPFIGERLVLQRPVSVSFASVVQEELGVRLEPTDPTQKTRSTGSRKVGLAFSGGVDSVAAMSVLPDDTALVFMDRVRPPGVTAPSKYRPEAARFVCEELAKRDREVYSIPTDLEFVRDPVGFPVFDRSSVESNGVGVLLLADFLELDAIAWGTIAEVAYGTGFGGFLDHARNDEHAAWRSVFSGVALDVVSPLIGVSEVGALKLLETSQFGSLAQSCVRGEVNEPCMDCWKCVRKTLTAAALQGRWPESGQLYQLLLVREFRRQLRFTPVPLANVLSYSIARAPDCAEVMWLLRSRLGIQNVEAEAYLERWYSPAASVWPLRYRDMVGGELDRRLGRMTKADEGRFRRWSPDVREEQEAVRSHALATVRYLDALAQDSNSVDDLVPLYRPYRQVREDDQASEFPVAELAEEVSALRGEIARLRTTSRYRRGNAVVRIARGILPRPRRRGRG